MSASAADMCKRLLERTAASDADDTNPSTEHPGVSSPIVLTFEDKSLSSWNRAFKSALVYSADYSYQPSAGEIAARLDSLSIQFERIA
jgi:hypothetical protein